MPTPRIKTHLSLTLLSAALILAGCVTNGGNPAPNTGPQGEVVTPVDRAAASKAEFEQSDMVQAISEHLGVTSESAASVIERLFREQGRPVGYITGEEGGGAVIGGLFYGKGTLWMKDGRKQSIFWQGPTIGFDGGLDASKVFTLVYGLQDPKYIYQRFPKAEGSAYFVAGMGVNYQRANGITLAPVRTGIGLRLGANIGYSNYTDKQRILWPF